MAEVSPDLFLDAVRGYQTTAAIKAALALDLFTAISQRGGNLSDFAAQTGASARGFASCATTLRFRAFSKRIETITG